MNKKGPLFGLRHRSLVFGHAMPLGAVLKFYRLEIYFYLFTFQVLCCKRRNRPTPFSLDLHRLKPMRPCKHADSLRGEQLPPLIQLARFGILVLPLIKFCIAPRPEELENKENCPHLKAHLTCWFTSLLSSSETTNNIEFIPTMNKKLVMRRKLIDKNNTSLSPSHHHPIWPWVCFGACRHVRLLQLLNVNSSRQNTVGQINCLGLKKGAIQGRRKLAVGAHYHPL